MKNVTVGDTVRVTWVSSDVVPSSIYTALFSGDETLVSSETMTSSGNGHYYSDITIPDTPAYYVARTNATINGKPYKRFTKLKAITGEVD